MKARYRGATLVDSAVAIVVGLVLAAIVCVATGPGNGSVTPGSLANLKAIGQAAGAYQRDNDDYLPMAMTYRRGISATYPPNPGPLEGWCTWQYGGKHCSAAGPRSWPGGSFFDVEADDRPLNSYLYDTSNFGAPPRPISLPVSSPLRDRVDLPVFRDPADNLTYQRQWPSPTPGISTYQSEGTSYLTNMAWWNHFTLPSDFTQRFNEGTRRIARKIGIHPARFVWLVDGVADVVMSHSSPQFSLVNWWGQRNRGLMLFVDGHTGYFSITPRMLNTADYQSTFQP